MYLLIIYYLLFYPVSFFIKFIALLNIFLMLNLFSANFMFCYSAFEQGNLELRHYINAVLLLCQDTGHMTSL